jgi:hypothetical protein
MAHDIITAAEQRLFDLITPRINQLIDRRLDAKGKTDLAYTLSGGLRDFYASGDCLFDENGPIALDQVTISISYGCPSSPEISFSRKQHLRRDVPPGRRIG